MRLGDILTLSRVTVRLDERLGGDEPKRAALRALAELFVPELRERGSVGEVARVFEAREALASTGVGSGVAIPHGRMEGIDRLCAAVAISRAGIEFDAIDGRPVHILVAVLGPTRGTGEHLKALARISRILRRPAVRDALVETSTDEEALRIVLEADGA